MFLEGGKKKDVHNERQNQQSAEKTFKEKDIDICNEYINKESLLNASKGSLGEGPPKKTTKFWTYVQNRSTLPT